MTEKKKPKFPRQYSSYKVRVKDKWRKPRGIDSRQRMGETSKGAKPRIGYSSPRNTRGLHPSGLKEVLVKNITELRAVEGEAIIRLASTIGEKKKEAMRKICEEKKLRVIN